MLHLSITVSLRVLVIVLLLGIVLCTGSDVARGAPSAANLTADTRIDFLSTGTNVAHDITVADQAGALRFYGCPTLGNPPNCAAIQFYGNSANLFGGQAFIDSGASNNAAIIFRTAPASQGLAERMRIEADGIVKVGSPTSSVCSFLSLCVQTDLTADDDVEAGDKVMATYQVWAGFPTSTHCDSAGDVCADDALVADGDVFTGSGCVKNTAGTVIAGSCPSDARLKQNIESLNPVLAQLTQLQPVTFDWRSEEFPALNLGTERNLGLIAQQVEAVLPGMVGENGDGYKIVHYEQLPILMLQGMREMKAENDILREQNATLEARLAAIEQRLNGGASPLVAAR